MKIKRFLLPVFAVILLLCLLPLGVSAETYGDFTYSVSGDTVTITKYNGSASRVEVPSEIDGKPVTAIGKNAFYDNNELSKVTIPASVQSIGQSAFEDCWFLSTVTMSDGLKEIGAYAFEGTGNLSNIVIPDSVTSIGRSCFEDSNVKSVKLPSSLTVISSNMFEGCEYLESINIPSGVTTIEYYAFKECTALKSVTFPNTLESIGDYAFYLCNALTAVTLPNSVTSVGTSAFLSCRSVSELKLSSSLTTIENYAFYAMNGVSTLVIPDRVTSIGENAFAYYSNLRTLTLPQSLTHIGSGAFASANLDDVHYKGTKSQWTSVSVGDSNGNLVEKLSHTWDASGNTCTVCGFHCVHSGGTATCLDPAVCDSCGYAYGEVNPNNHASSETYFLKTSEAEHTQYHSCCNGVLAASAHSVNQTEDQPANCQIGAYCHVCQDYYGEKDPDNHTSTETSYTSVDHAQHVLRHSCCRKEISTGAHTIVDGTCTVCNRRFNVFITHGTATYGYSSFSAALAAAQELDGCTVTLNRYSEGNGDGYRVEKGNFTIDLNNCNISSTDNDTITVERNAKLTITDSAGGGYIKSSNGYALMIDGGEVHIQGGHLREEYTNAIYSVYLNDGKLYLEGGTVDGIFVNQDSSELYISGDAAGNPRTCRIHFQVRNIVDWLPRVQITQALTGDDTYTFRNERVGNVVAGGLNYTLTEADAARFAYQDNSLVVALNETDNTLFMKGSVAGATVTLSPAEFTYDGTAKTPAVTVVHYAKTLTENTDYTVSYSNNTNAGTATVTITGKGNFVGSKEATFPIHKAAAPAITFPAVLNEITYGQRLQDAELSFYDNSYGTFNWVDPTGIANAGSGNYALDFYPSETSLQNYDWKDANGAQWIESRNALCICPDVTVNKADMQITAPVPNTLSYTGEPQTLAREGSWENENNALLSGGFYYSLEKNGTYQAQIPQGTAVGEYTLWYRPDNASADNYNDVGPWHVTLTIAKATPNVVPPTELTATVGQTLQDVVLPNGWSWNMPTASVGESGGNPFVATFTPEDTDNYETVSMDLTVIVLPDTSGMDGVTEDTVTEAQKAELEQLLEVIENVLAIEDIPADKREELEANREKLEALLAGLPPYSLTKGDGSSWTKGSSADLSFTASGHFARFTAIKVDGNVVDAANYTAVSGSTKVTLKAAYLETLSRGQHTIAVCYSDGTATGTFKITRIGGAPSTGDPAQPMLFVTMLSAGAAGLYLTLRKRKHA